MHMFQKMKQKTPEYMVIMHKKTQILCAQQRIELTDIDFLNGILYYFVILMKPVS